MLRLFIALPIAGETRDALERYQKSLYALGLDGSFTRPENLHLTLAFLGAQKQAAPVIEAMRAVSTAGPVSLLLDRPGRFQQRDGALLWLGASRDRPVQKLAAAVVTALRTKGFPLEERSFQTHITLCRRVRHDEAVPRLPEACIPFRADSMVLYRSHISDGVPTYTPLYIQPLSREEP